MRHRRRIEFEARPSFCSYAAKVQNNSYSNDRPRIRRTAVAQAVLHGLAIQAAGRLSRLLAATLRDLELLGARSLAIVELGAGAIDMRGQGKEHL